VTPDELRRRADRKQAEAAGLAADASRIRSAAGSLRGLLDPLIPLSQRVWVGPAATDFESQVKAHALRLDGEADKLVAVAADFDRQAAGGRREAARLRAQAEAADLVVGGV
jgi:hypothetical protein